MSSRTKVRAGTVRVNPVTSEGIRPFEVEGILTFTIIEGELSGIEIEYQIDRKTRTIRSVLASWNPNLAFSLDPKKSYRTRLTHRNGILASMDVFSGDRIITFTKVPA